jgi:hypothetical protein
MRSRPFQARALDQTHNHLMGTDTHRNVELEQQTGQVNFFGWTVDN